MPYPSVTVEGNLTRDPQLTFTASGKAICKFSVACNSRKKDPSGEWTDDEPSFFDVLVWERKGEALVEAGLSKGDPVVVVGRLRVRGFEHNGEKRTAVEVTADTVGMVARNPKTSAGGQRAVEADPWGRPDPAFTPQHVEPPF